MPFPRAHHWRCGALVALMLSCPFAAAEETASVAVDDQLLTAALDRAGDNRAQIETALDAAPAEHSAAVRFLVAYMPQRDLRALSAEYILNNVEVAYRARAATPWGEQIPDDVFFNDVLPYAAVNERRDDWRADFYERFMPMVEACRTPAEAAQVLNRDLYKLLDVQYHASKRPKPDQSPYESMEAKYASCTGLSILLIDACRAVCVPARFAGTPSWTTKRGNHSWVEIYSEGNWHFTGACEYDPAGLDRGWFVADASRAKRDDPRHAIYASSWRSTGTRFPLVWARGDDSVAAVNVTDRYRPAQTESEIPGGKVLVGIEVWSRADGERVVREVLVRGAGTTHAQGKTTGSGDDANHRLEIILEPNRQYTVNVLDAAGNAQEHPLETTADKRQLVKLFVEKVEVEPTGSEEATASAAAVTALQEYLQQNHAERPALIQQPLAAVPLSKKDATQAAALLWDDHAARIRQSRAEEMEQREIVLDGKPLRFDYTIYGEKPAGGRSLFISLHGGGGAPARVNDRQWENQKSLYQPKEGVYLAPRAPTDTWNLWHEAHIDPLFDRLIANLVVFEDVNPNRVYVMGYSAGGDGVYQLAPRMADRWAAAAMMAGHPNEASPLGLRNIGFALHVGAEDGAYNRNRVARDWKKKLAELHQQDPQGYRHEVQIHAGKGHWMDRQDAVAVPWMAAFERNVRPRRIVWYQDDVTQRRFYWLAVDQKHQQAGTLVRATRDGQAIDINSEQLSAVTVLLDDQMLDLDKPVIIRLGGHEVFTGAVPRTIAALAESLAERSDPTALFTARVAVER